MILYLFELAILGLGIDIAIDTMNYGTGLNAPPFFWIEPFVTRYGWQFNIGRLSIEFYTPIPRRDR